MLACPARSASACAVGLWSNTDPAPSTTPRRRQALALSTRVRGRAQTAAAAGAEPQRQESSKRGTRGRESERLGGGRGGGEGRGGQLALGHFVCRALRHCLAVPRVLCRGGPLGLQSLFSTAWQSAGFFPPRVPRPPPAGGEGRGGQLALRHCLAVPRVLCRGGPLVCSLYFLRLGSLPASSHPAVAQPMLSLWGEGSIASTGGL